MLDANRALIQICVAQNRLADAEAIHDKQVAAMRKLFGPKDSRLANALDEQAAFLDTLGRTDQAKNLRAEANRIRTAALQP